MEVRWLLWSCTSPKYLMTSMFAAYFSEFNYFYNSFQQFCWIFFWKSYSIRGRLGSFTQLSLNVGLFAVYTLGAIVDYKSIPCIFVLVPVLYVIAFISLPDTPMHYLRNDRLSVSSSSSVVSLKNLTISITLLLFFYYRYFDIDNIRKPMTRWNITSCTKERPKSKPKSSMWSSRGLNQLRRNNKKTDGFVSVILVSFFSNWIVFFCENSVHTLMIIII